MKTIGIIGSRSRNANSDYLRTLKAFARIVQHGDRIVSGGCTRGGDAFAEKISKTYRIPITIHLADWDLLGRRAGFVRNTLIAKDADVLIAVVSENRKGGTEDTIKKFQKFHPDGILILV